MESLLTTDTSSQLWTASITDPVSGSSLAVFKSGYSCSRSLCATKERLIIASKDRPILNVWDFRAARKDGQPQRLTCPGNVTALATSPDNVYLAVGIAEKVYLWQITDGLLVAVLTTHYQTVTRIRFTDDGSHLVTASKDNMVLIWEMSEVVCSQGSAGKPCSPLHVLSSHTLPVTDLFVGSGGPMAHMVSSSLDHSCKVWELCSGQQLCNLLFDVPVESIAFDAAETHLFAGCSDGSIYLVNLHPEESSYERHISETDSSSISVFKGHSSSVTCLCVSMDGTMLASGSTDCTARIWDISSGQCLRTIQHKGAVGAVEFILRPPTSTPSAANLRALPPLPNLQRNFAWSGTGDAASQGGIDGGSAMKISRPTEVTDERYATAVGLPRSLKEGNNKMYNYPRSQKTDTEEVSRLRQINAQLYQLYSQSLLEDTETSSSGNEY